MKIYKPKEGTKPFSFLVKDVRRTITGYGAVCEIDGKEHFAMITPGIICAAGDCVDIIYHPTETYEVNGFVFKKTIIKVNGTETPFRKNS